SPRSGTARSRRAGSRAPRRLRPSRSRCLLWATVSPAKGTRGFRTSRVELGEVSALGGSDVPQGRFQPRRPIVAALDLPEPLVAHRAQQAARVAAVMVGVVTLQGASLRKADRAHVLRYAVNRDVELRERVPA